MRDATRDMSPWVEIRPTINRNGVRATSISYIEKGETDIVDGVLTPRPRAQSCVSPSRSNSLNGDANLRGHSRSGSFSFFNMNSPPRLRKARTCSYGDSSGVGNSMRSSCEDMLHGVRGSLGTKSTNNSPRAHAHSTSFASLYDICKEQHVSLEMIRIYSTTNSMDFKIKNKDGRLPLHICIDRDDPSTLVVREVLKHYPEAAKIKDKNGNLPLFLACRRKKVSAGVIKALLRIYPEAAGLKIMGQLALHHLVHTGSPSPDAVSALINANPQAPSTPNAFGNLPLHYLCALKEPHIHVVRILMTAYPLGVQQKNKKNETPIERALQGCAVDDVDLKLSTIQASIRQSRERSGSVWSSPSSTSSSFSSSSSVTTSESYDDDCDGDKKSPQSPTLLKTFSSDSNDTDSQCGHLDQLMESDTDPKLLRERVRLLLRVSDADALSEDQKVLLKELNYEAKRLALLVFVSMCRKFSKFPVRYQETTIKSVSTQAPTDVDEVHGIDPVDAVKNGITPEFRKAAVCQDIWFNILSYI